MGSRTARLVTLNARLANPPEAAQKHNRSSLFRSRKRAPRRGCLVVILVCVSTIAGRSRIKYGWNRRDAVSSLLANSDASRIDSLVSRVLSPWRARGGVALADVDAAFAVNEKQDAACFIVQNIDRKLFTVGDADRRPKRGKWNPGQLFRTRRRNILQLLHRAVTVNDVPDFEATFCLHDCVVSQRRDTKHNMFSARREFVSDPVAAFSVVSCVDSMNVPFPTWDYATGYFDKWGSKIDAIVAEANAHDWISRKAQAVFRGGQRTCVLYPKVGERSQGVPFYRVTKGDGENAKKCGRNALLYRALSNESNHLFNVALTDGVDWRSFGHELRRPPDEPRFLSKSTQETFKYQIIAEGECQWANRLRDALFMGTTLIVQDHQCVEYYGLELKPWEHFIPVDYWFTNLSDAVNWAESNPAAVEKMNHAKRRYAESFLAPERVEEYVATLMREYAKLLTYRVRRRVNAVDVDVSTLAINDPPVAWESFSTISRVITNNLKSVLNF